jgi:hypothetical protein
MEAGNGYGFYPYMYRSPWRCDHCKEYNFSWGKGLTCQHCGAPYGWESYEVTRPGGNIWTQWRKVKGEQS